MYDKSFGLFNSAGQRRTFNSLHIIWNKNKLQVAKNRKIKVYENQNAQRYEAKATEKNVQQIIITIKQQQKI